LGGVIAVARLWRPLLPVSAALFAAGAMSVGEL
jgi:hypothetical protein